MKTIPYFSLAILLFLTVGLASCEKGNGVLVTRTFELGAFDKIDLRRHADIYITQGATRSVTIEAEENLMDLITTDIVEGEWKIDFKKTVKEYLTMTIRITMPNLSSVKVIEGSGGDVFLENTIETNNLLIELSGDGSINGDVQVADKLTTTLVGSGNITITGTADKHEVTTSGAGLVATYGLVGNTGSVQVNGTGDAQVRFTGMWSATITGLGNIRYKGTAPTSVEITGSGEVTLVP